MYDLGAYVYSVCVCMCVCVCVCAMSGVICSVCVSLYTIKSALILTFSSVDKESTASCDSMCNRSPHPHLATKTKTMATVIATCK